MSPRDLLTVAGRPTGAGPWRRQVAEQAHTWSPGSTQGLVLDFDLKPGSWVDLDTLAENTLAGLRDAGVLATGFRGLETFIAIKDFDGTPGVALRAATPARLQALPDPGPTAADVSSDVAPRSADRDTKRAWRAALAAQWGERPALTGVLPQRPHHPLAARVPGGRTGRPAASGPDRLVDNDCHLRLAPRPFPLEPVRVVRLVAVVLLLLPACTPTSGSSGRQIVATVYPLTWLAQEIAPDAEVVSLAAKGQDPHDLELTPGQRGSLERALLVAYLGDIGFQPQVERGISEVGGATLAVAEVVGEQALRPVEGAQGHDPHVWFDARLMARVALEMGEALAAADPPRAAEYHDNAGRTSDALESLAGDIDGLLENCTHETVVVSHEAYAYLLAPHGLEQRGISGAGAHAEASPADIAGLTDLIDREGITTVLSEPVEGRTDAEAVAGEAGVEIADIYSLDIVEGEQEAKGFPALLREQAQAVAQAAGCSGAEAAA